MGWTPQLPAMTTPDAIQWRETAVEGGDREEGDNGGNDDNRHPPLLQATARRADMGCECAGMTGLEERRELGGRT